jgi:succinate dehydrogenase / fumarate reductase iron-sulfur subunit
MMINGRNELACQLLLRDEGTEISVEPLRVFSVIKDLVVDMEAFWAKYRSILPWPVTTDDPGYWGRSQTPEERERYDDTAKRILFACCTSSYPINWGNPATSAPPRSSTPTGSSRLPRRRSRATPRHPQCPIRGVGLHRTFNCTECCPRNIKVTQAIEEVKRAIPYDRV